MGNCIITVQVTGAHHNCVDADIDQMASAFVDDLQRKGHSIQSASLVSGGAYDLLNVAGRFPVKIETARFLHETEESI